MALENWQKNTEQQLRSNYLPERKGKGVVRLMNAKWKTNPRPKHVHIKHFFFFNFRTYGHLKQRLSSQKLISNHSNQLTCTSLYKQTFGSLLSLFSKKFTHVGDKTF